MGRTRLFIIFGAVIVVMAVFFSFMFMNERARVRDALRLRDMRQIEQHYQQTYLATGSFRQTQFPDVNDPGGFSYVARQPTDTTFSVSFRLERTHDRLRAGDHTLTERGIE